MESGPYTLEIAKRWIRGVMELRGGLDMLQKAIMDLRTIIYFFFHPPSLSIKKKIIPLIMASSRGKSFTPEQDEAICRAYLCITEDPIIGNSQPRTQFWIRVLQEYCEKTNDDQRSEVSIKSRWQIIQRCCNKFRGCLRSVEALHQSGMTHQNEVINSSFFIELILIIFYLIIHSSYPIYSMIWQSKRTMKILENILVVWMVVGPS